MSASRVAATEQMDANLGLALRSIPFGHQHERTAGTKLEVWHGTARRTAGGLTIDKLGRNKNGRIVSIAKYRHGHQQVGNLAKTPFFGNLRAAGAVGEARQAGRAPAKAKSAKKAEPLLRQGGAQAAAWPQHGATWGQPAPAYAAPQWWPQQAAPAPQPAWQGQWAAAPAPAPAQWAGFVPNHGGAQQAAPAPAYPMFY
jgi:DVNP family